MDLNTSNASHAVNAMMMKDIGTEVGDPVPLESLALEAYARSVVSYGQKKSDVINRLEKPGLTSPEELQAIQEKAADYSLNLSLLSTISRKATSAVETLLRS